MPWTKQVAVAAAGAESGRLHGHTPAACQSCRVRQITPTLVHSTDEEKDKKDQKEKKDKEKDKEKDKKVKKDKKDKVVTLALACCR